MSAKNDKAYISWLEDRVYRLECELAERKAEHIKSIQNNIAFLDKLNQSLNNA